jgi:hypothetical protein
MRILLGVMALAPALGARAEQHPFHDPTSLSTPAPLSYPIALHAYLNNRATSSPSHPASGAGMGCGATYPAQYLPEGGWVHEGVDFVFAPWSGDVDNVRADGERIVLEEAAALLAVHLVTSGEGAGGELG